MSRKLLAILSLALCLDLLPLNSCGPPPEVVIVVTETQVPTETLAPTPTAMSTPTPTATLTPTATATMTPTPTEMPLPSPTSTATATSTPRPTVRPTSAPTIHTANFAQPVDPNVVPLYNAFDLDPRKGVVSIQSPRYPPRTDFLCDGHFFLPGTPDNHFAWDWGTGNCSKHLVGTPVYGMSVGFQGEVKSVGFDSPKYPIIVDYGLVRCTDGKVRHLTIQFGHSLPNVKRGDKVDSGTVIGHLEEVSVEIEVQVFGDGRNLNPRLIGLQLP